MNEEVDKNKIEEEEKIRVEARVKAEEELSKKKKDEENKKVGLGCLVLIGIIVFIVILVSLSGNGEDSVITESELSVEETQSREQGILAILEENFMGIANIELDSEREAFAIIPIDPDFTIELAYALDGNPQAIQSWNSMAENIRYLSEKIEMTLPGYAIELRNPANVENTILMVLDGYILYDALNE